MKKKTELMKKAMNIRYLLFIVLLFIAHKSIANDGDSLLIYLNESDSAFTVDLVFENTSSDTIMIPAIYENFYWEYRATIGIGITAYHNQHPFKLRISAEFPPFRFSDKKIIFISPKKKMSYSINLYQYFGGITEEDDLEVDFNVRCMFVRYLKKADTSPAKINIRTNRVKVKSIK